LFLQAEDGIRDRNVTGVQTCALPISEELTVLHHLRQQDEKAPGKDMASLADFVAPEAPDYVGGFAVTTGLGAEDLSLEYKEKNRSEERRVGRECRTCV